MANADKLRLAVGATTATFVFKLDGEIVGHFQEVSGLEVSIETEEVAEGGQNGYKHTLPGRLSWPNIVLKRTVTTSNRLLEWALESSGPGFTAKGNKLARKHGSIDLLSRDGTKLAGWEFDGAMVVRWSGPSFTVASDDVLVEECEIAHDGFTVAAG